MKENGKFNVSQLRKSTKYTLQWKTNWLVQRGTGTTFLDGTKSPVMSAQKSNCPSENDGINTKDMKTEVHWQGVSLQFPSPGLRAT